MLPSSSHPPGQLCIRGAVLPRPWHPLPPPPPTLLPPSPCPQGLEAKVEKNTTITITGSDKELVGQFAANIRSKREPEPYKGKGVRYSDEVVRRKEGKRGK